MGHKLSVLEEGDSTPMPGAFPLLFEDEQAMIAIEEDTVPERHSGILTFINHTSTPEAKPEKFIDDAQIAPLGSSQKRKRHDACEKGELGNTWTSEVANSQSLEPILKRRAWRTLTPKDEELLNSLALPEEATSPERILKCRQRGIPSSASYHSLQKLEPLYSLALPAENSFSERSSMRKKRQFSSSPSDVPLQEKELMNALFLPQPESLTVRRCSKQRRTMPTSVSRFTKEDEELINSLELPVSELPSPDRHSSPEQHSVSPQNPEFIHTSNNTSAKQTTLPLSTFQDASPIERGMSVEDSRAYKKWLKGAAALGIQGNLEMYLARAILTASPTTTASSITETSLLAESEESLEEENVGNIFSGYMPSRL